MDDHLDIQIKYVRTGRTVHHDPIIERKVIDFINEKSTVLYKHLDEIISNFNLAVSSNVEVYRGIKKGSELQFNDCVFGIPEKIKQPSNRYNMDVNEHGIEQTSLYTTDDPSSIPFEIGEVEWLEQKYNIPAGGIKIADLRIQNAVNIHPDLNAVFMMAESGVTFSGFNIEEAADKGGKNRFAFSQMLADFFRKYDWCGMYVPGVRNKEHLYNNLVIFHPASAKWREWTIGNYYRKHNN